MSSQLQVILSLLLFICSVFTLSIKGYFNVIRFKSDTNAPIEEYANNSFAGKVSYFSLGKEDLIKSLRNKFPEVSEVTLRRNIDMSVSLFVKEHSPFAYNSETNQYIASNGIAFRSSKKYDKNFPEYQQYFSDSDTVLSTDEISFIQSLSVFPYLTLARIDSHTIQITTDETPDIVIERQNEDLIAMVKPITNILSKVERNEMEAERILVINNKLVLKK